MQIRMRVSLQWWFEWVEHGERKRSPAYKKLGRDGALAAAHGLTMGHDRYGIRHGSEVIIPNDKGREPNGVRVSRLFVDGRMMAGAELKRLLAGVAASRERKRGITAQQLAKLDADLARIS